jgi:hypothetical protein
MDGQEQNPGYTAARLTLLALRAGLPIHHAVDREQVIVRPRSERVSIVVAALRLAQLPKPLFCVQELDGNYMVVTCAPVGARDDWQAQYERVQANNIRRGGLSGFIKRARSNSDANGSSKVLCKGRDETLVLSLEEAEEWARDYHWEGQWNYSANPRGNGVETLRGNIEEQPTNVVAVLTFGASEARDFTFGLGF